MPELTILSPSEQVAAHLRGELLQGVWSETMPGVPTLAAELGIDSKTVGAALRLLEGEGLLVGQGPGRARRIVLPPDGAVASMRIAILAYDPPTKNVGFIVEVLHRLMEAGHRAAFTPGSLVELGLDVQRVAQLVHRNKADVWVVTSGSSEVLEWFAEQEIPTMALFGRFRTLRIAGTGPDHGPALRSAVQRLMELGHRRIVLLERQSRREGGPGQVERAIFEEMAARGISPGPYNLPDWEDTLDGFHRLLDELFRVTPPTALLIDAADLFHAAKDHLARRGILAPDHVSLICTDFDPTFGWCRPSVAHIRWDYRPVVHRIVRWAANLSRGKKDLRQTLTKAEFIEGGTVGPAFENNSQFHV